MVLCSLLTMTNTAVNMENFITGYPAHERESASHTGFSHNGDGGRPRSKWVPSSGHENRPDARGNEASPRRGEVRVLLRQGELGEVTLTLTLSKASASHRD